MGKFERMDSFSSLTESGKRICHELHKSPALPASTLSILTGLSRQTVYKETDKLVRKGLVKLANNRPKKLFTLSEEIPAEEIRVIESFKPSSSFFDMAGHAIPGIFYGKANQMMYGPFVERTSLFLSKGEKDGNLKPYLFRKPLDELNGLKSINVAFLKFKKMLADLYPDNHRVTWVISPYHQKHFLYGANINTFLKGLEEERPENASISLSCDVPSYHGNHLYILDCRYSSFNRDGKEYSRLDQVTLAILTNFIPIGQKFVIDWDKIDPLPFVREAEVSESPDWSATFVTADIQGYLPDSYPQIIATNMIISEEDRQEHERRIIPRGGLCFFSERRKSLQEALGNVSNFEVKGISHRIKYKNQSRGGLPVYILLAGAKEEME